MAPQYLCSALLHHHSAVYGPPLLTPGVQRGREGVCDCSSNLAKCIMITAWSGYCLWKLKETPFGVCHFIVTILSGGQDSHDHLHPQRDLRPRPHHQTLPVILCLLRTSLRTQNNADSNKAGLTLFPLPSALVRHTPAVLSLTSASASMYTNWWCWTLSGTVTMTI